jgi:hypothetical protein
MTSQKSSEKDAASLCILKIASCPTLSGKSTLTYHIGCKDGADVLFRIYGNTGGGLYSNDWISLKEIQRAFGTQALVTSGSLQSACKGKSANTAGFVLAAMKQEGLIGRSKDDPRKYVRIESDVFASEIRSLIDGNVDLDTETSAGVAPLSERPSGKRKGKAPKETMTQSEHVRE